MAKRIRHKTQRRKLFELHSWLGFNFAIFMSLVIVTGTFAVIADEIDWLINQELRVEPGESSADKVSWGEMQQAIRVYAPKDTISMFSAGEADYFAYRALMTNEFGDDYYLYINQWTGEVTGTTSMLTVQRFLRDLHRYLFLPNIIGLPIVTIMTVVLLISLYTGLKTIRNWKTVATRIRFNKGGRVAMGDFHKAAGLWGSWFLLLIVITSFWYFSELSFAVGGVRFEPNRPGVTEERVAEMGEVAFMADADTLVTAAIKAYPGFKPTEIQFSTSAMQSVTVLGRGKDPLVRKRANRVFLDPFDASVIKVQRSTEINWVAYLNELADPLHFGSFGKLTTKLIWFVLGIGLFALTVTGVILTWKRVKTKTPTTAQLANLPIVIMTIMIGVIYVKSYIDKNEPEHSVTLGKKIDDVNVEIILSIDNEENFNGSFFVQASTEKGRLNIKSGRVVLQNTKYGVDVEPILLGSNITLVGELPPDQLLRNDSLSVSLDFFSGSSITRSWSVENY